jgi:hypothetical protein
MRPAGAAQPARPFARANPACAANLLTPPPAVR